MNKQETMEEVPEELYDWYEIGKSYEINKDRTTEELDSLKEAVVGISFALKYCRETTLPEAVADQIMMEAATRWYERDFNTKVADPYSCKELPAYYEHVKNFVMDFSKHISNVRATYNSPTDIPTERDINLPDEKP